MPTPQSDFFFIGPSSLEAEQAEEQFHDNIANVAKSSLSREALDEYDRGIAQGYYAVEPEEEQHTTFFGMDIPTVNRNQSDIFGSAKHARQRDPINSRLEIDLDAQTRTVDALADHLYRGFGRVQGESSGLNWRLDYLYGRRCHLPGPGLCLAVTGW